MILQLIFYTLISVIAVLILHVVIRTVQVHFAFVRHKKNLKGLPILPETWCPGGHMHQVYFTDYNCFKIEALHRLHGKTFGFLYGTTPMASTTDLDLIKKLALDGPKVNTDRANLTVAVADLQDHSILFANGDYWRQLRKAIAPSFT